MSGTNSLRIKTLFDGSKRKLFVGAHPDDVEMFAGYLVYKTSFNGNVYVAIATDGAPRRQDYYPRGNANNPEEYARIRRQESLSALDFLGVPASNTHFLGYVDQEVVLSLESLIKDMSYLIGDISPDQIFGFAYEGSHPDHDATRIAIDEALKRLNYDDESFEYAACNYYDGTRNLFRFIPRTGFRPVRIHIPVEERSVKDTIFDMFESQKGYLDPIPNNVEAYRVSPPYDFSELPANRPLFYEIGGIPITPEEFLNAVAEYFGDKS